MERRFSTTEIDRFFTYLKEQPPIYNDEKVHQIINSPEAKARLKGKSQNLLKFTIMTTIFAIIISAVLWWPGGGSNTKYKVQSTKYQDAIQEKVSSIKYQDTRPFGSDSNSTNTNSASSSCADIKNDESTNDNKLLAIANQNDSDSRLASNQPNEAVGSSDKSSQPAQQNRQNNIGFDPDTIKPIDGNPFIITADKTMLEKLGFQFRNGNVFYQNKSPEGIISVLNYFKVKYEFGTGIFHRTLNDKIVEDSVSTSALDFYPVITSYKTGNIISSNLGDGFNFELVNDTLFPIGIPQGLISDDPNDIIVWFKTSKDFFKRVPENQHPLSRDYSRIKRIKDQKECNLIDYSPLRLLNPSTFIELTDSELLKLGFYIRKWENPLQGKSGEFIKRIEIDTKTESTLISTDFAKNVAWNNINYDRIEVGKNRFVLQPKDSSNTIPDIWLFFTSNTKGDIINKINSSASGEIVNLIPVKVSKQSLGNILEEDIIFWFKPTNYLFERLPFEVSRALRKEYNYITAEDKSKLVKPVCKYFDECKNTLDVSKFKVFPNPANNTATVSFTLNEAITGRIILVDLTGRERQVLQPQTSLDKGSHQIDIDVSNVPEGIYLLTLYSDKGVQTQRLIVAR